jgi:catechol 2,3-dioxygenase-like lactoylglutathione lyase family enzyme
MLFHHVGVHVADIARSRKLYDALLQVLQVESYELPGHKAVAYGTTSCSFRVVQPPGGDVTISSSHICLTAPSEAAVRKFYDVGTSLGAKGIAPNSTYVDWGFRHVSSMIADYDGNRIETVFVDRG